MIKWRSKYSINRLLLTRYPLRNQSLEQTIFYGYRLSAKCRKRFMLRKTLILMDHIHRYHQCILTTALTFEKLRTEYLIDFVASSPLTFPRVIIKSLSLHHLNVFRWQCKSRYADLRIGDWNIFEKVYVWSDLGPRMSDKNSSLYRECN